MSHITSNKGIRPPQGAGLALAYFLHFENVENRYSNFLIFLFLHSFS